MFNRGLNIKNKFLLCSVFISWGISFVLYLYALWVSWYGTITSWSYVFYPAIVVTLIYFIGQKTTEKYPKLTKILTAILNTAIIIFVQLFICGLMTLLFANIDERAVTEVKDYHHALSSIGWQDRVSHFPKEIPPKAENTILRKYSNNWFGSEGIHLSFEISDEYIKKELLKYKFQKIEGPYKNSSNYEYLFRTLDDIEIHDYKVYYIKIEKDYVNGIAVRYNRILYFYSYPD